MRDDRDDFDSDWRDLCVHIRREASELVLLPEMPFARWFAVTRAFDAAVWREALDGHARWEERIRELAAPFVIATRPAEHGAKRLNEAFLVTQGDSRGIHEKRYLPDEDGYWEASWYQAGNGVFDAVEIGGAAIGVQICTEMWMLDVSRQYGLRDCRRIGTRNNASAKCGVRTSARDRTRRPCRPPNGLGTGTTRARA
jgi:N-carbamoylputrescine amidase